MNLILYFFALLCGIATSVQSGVNSELRRSINNPIAAAIISFSTGLLSLLLVTPFFSKYALPNVELLRSLEWWKFTGGLLGAFFVTTVIMTISKIGAANMAATILTGQMLMTIILDHFGILGFPLHPANIWRILGVILLILGVYLVVNN